MLTDMFLLKFIEESDLKCRDIDEYIYRDVYYLLGMVDHKEVELKV